MPVFDGSPIKAGDRLHDFNEGTLTVLQLFSDNIQLMVPGKGTRTYGYNGVRVGKAVKTLFWHNPVIVTPPKEPEVWSAQRDLVSAVSNSMGPLAPHIISDGPVPSPYSVRAD